MHEIRPFDKLANNLFYSRPYAMIVLIRNYPNIAMEMKHNEETEWFRQFYIFHFILKVKPKGERKTERA